MAAPNATPRRAALIFSVCALLACGGGTAVATPDARPASPDAAAPDEAPPPPDALLDADPPTPDAPLPDSRLDAPLLDAAAPDAPAPAPDALAADAPAPPDAPSERDEGPVEACPVPDLRAIYPGFLPTNPYAPRAPATTCVARAHDVVLVLGCPNNADGTPATCQTRRADMAAALYRAGLGARFITSGAAVHTPFVEADTLATLLIARGVPAEAIVRENRARHTDENIYYSTTLMTERGWRSAWVVSEDPGHLIMTAVCDANCCVQRGRLTVFDLRVGDQTLALGHYVTEPPATLASGPECDHLRLPTKVMCLNLSSRNACAGRLRL